MMAKIAMAGTGASLLLAVAALLAPAYAQQEKIARIGILSAAQPDEFSLVETLRALGYVPGKNVLYEVRFANWQTERLPELVRELLRQKVDVIVAYTNIPGFAAKKTTDRVPIVVWGIHGALETGLVRDLARPRGNVTGVESLAPQLDAKRLELIRAIVPNIARIGVVYNLNDPGTPFHLESTREAAQKLGVRVVPLPVNRADDFESVLSAASGSIDALLTFTDDLTAWNWHKIAEFASKHRLPTVCEFRILVQGGCLLSYGPSFDEFNSVVARQVDKILKGAKAGDLPIEQARRFELLLNSKTAKLLGTTIPQSILTSADKVIE